MATTRSRCGIGARRAARAVVAAWLWAGAYFSTPVSAEGSEPVVLANAKLQLALRPRDAEVCGLSLGPGASNLVGGAGGSAGPWRLLLAPPASRAELQPGQADSFRTEREGANGLRFTWQGFGLTEAPSLTVVAGVRLGDTPGSSLWNLAVENLGTLRLRGIRFPELHNLERRDRECLAAPAWMGELTRRPRELLAGQDGRGRRLEYAYPGLTSLQCLAWYQEDGPGFFLASDDTNAFRKAFVFEGSPGGRVDGWVEHWPEDPGVARPEFALPYRVRVDAFEGDWFTAAARYREWATNQYWAQASRRASGKVPDWASDTALWVWNRGRSPNVLPPALTLQAELGLPVSVFWHWWHGCSYDTGFPEYLPPREGADAFRAALAKAHAHGVRAIVYMNQRLWGMTTSSWTNLGAAAFAVKGADGQIRPEVYNTFTRAACASMCLHTAFWRDRYAALAQSAIQQLGVDGIYMDQACSSLACYDPTHGHPLGGGTYWMQGFRQLEAGIRARVAPFPVTLAGEGAGESWLPHLDLMLSLQVSRERYAGPDGWEPIPFFQAVYHPFAIQFGNYSSLTEPPYDELWPPEFAPKAPLALLDRKYGRQFQLEHARAVIWGQQPTLANFLPRHFETRRDELAPVLDLARLRRQAAKYLQDGIFLRPPRTALEEVSIDLSRLSIYAGRGGGLTHFEGRVAPVVVAAWRASDGDLGVALANVIEKPVEVTLELDREAHRLAAPSRLWRITAAGREPVGLYERIPSRVTTRLPDRGACVLAFERP